MMLGTTVYKQVMSIRDVVPLQEMTKRVKWIQFTEARKEYINTLKSKGIRGADYSSLVSRWDKQYAGKCIFDI
jgi:hypothetical protein